MTYGMDEKRLICLFTRSFANGMEIADASTKEVFVVNGKRKKQVKNSTRARAETTLGELIATLCEETERVLGENGSNIIVAYILNDLLRNAHSRNHDRERRRCRKEMIGSNRS